MHLKRTIGLIWLSSLLLAMGCASALTMSAPRVEETRTGDKGVGQRINAVYMLEEDEGIYTLTRQPYCKETIEEIQISRKRPRGFIIALCELPLYGLGAVDYLMAKIYANASEEELGRLMADSGDVIPCGDVEKAPGEKVLLQFPDSGRLKNLLTDDNAVIQLDECFKKSCRDLQIHVFVKKENDILYISTIDKTYTH
ncbi:hypothetical protein [Desulfoluna butyratoxydans]|uniref:Lipoprotein n=1 Tax=Desulfoluna butyratoxydans TaxID=231438 RepID=A0A4U8YQJ3_9BACT|nr:hypothetical protein [Desulfoluna butyratoxydans]VFQ43513.1 hypothetical protein MSL71_11480 [Desulfoluna butyratoxydans]